MPFDHTVHIRDKKTGKIIRADIYSMECHKDLKFYRRAGKCFDAAGVEIPDPKLVGKIAGVAIDSAPLTTRSHVAPTGK